jgi:hypothetical protein
LPVKFDDQGDLHPSVGILSHAASKEVCRPKLISEAGFSEMSFGVQFGDILPNEIHWVSRDPISFVERVVFERVSRRG